jgi:hypothetical protein
LACTSANQTLKQCLDHMLLLVKPEDAKGCASACSKGMTHAGWDQKATGWQEQKYLLGIAPCRVVSLQLSRVMGKGAGSASLATALLEINAHACLKQSFIRALLL